MYAMVYGQYRANNHDSDKNINYIIFL